MIIGPKQGPALHTHHRDDELWVVLEGDFRFKTGGAILPASTGGMAFGPRGTPHAFQNLGDVPGRLLVVTTPSGLEGFFQDSPHSCEQVQPAQRGSPRSAARTAWTSSVLP